MQSYLILKLQGAMQAWGSHTYEDYRPSLIFPTRSAVVGLLGVCLGLERKKPHYTPYLGRRSCPLQRPLFDSIVNADSASKHCDTFNPKVRYTARLNCHKAAPCLCGIYRCLVINAVLLRAPFMSWEGNMYLSRVTVSPAHLEEFAKIFRKYSANPS